MQPYGCIFFKKQTYQKWLTFIEPLPTQTGITYWTSFTKRMV